MNEFRAIALSRKNGRVPVFEETLKTLDHVESPWIVEIGGFRAELPEHIDGDGFSIFYWAEFIAKKGSGKLTVVDIDPIAIEKTRKVLLDFEGKVDIELICADGLDYLKKLGKNPSLVYLDGPDQPEWFTYECFRLINRTKTAVLCDDANGWEVGLGKCPRVRQNYKQYVLYKVGPIHEMIYYPLVQGNDKTFKIGSLELEYIREDINSAWRNARSVELPLLKWFAEKYNNNVVELGAVSNQYSFFKGWDIVDPYDHYPLSIRKDILEYDYTDKNIFSCSTIEHCGVDLGYNQKEDKDLAIKGLQKIIKEAKNYLITFPIGANYFLQDYVMDSSLSYVIMKRKNIRGETNNWKEDNNKDNFYLPYFHFSYLCDFFGCGAVIVVVTNQPEILGKTN